MTPAVSTSAMGDFRSASLRKGAQRFVVHYEVGQESAVLDHLTDLVHRADVDFDWFDAALLAHQVGQTIAEELAAFAKAKGTPHQ